MRNTPVWFFAFGTINVAVSDTPVGATAPVARGKNSLGSKDTGDRVDRPYKNQRICVLFLCKDNIREAFRDVVVVCAHLVHCPAHLDLLSV